MQRTAVRLGSMRVCRLAGQLVPLHRSASSPASFSRRSLSQAVTLRTPEMHMVVGAPLQHCGGCPPTPTPPPFHNITQQQHKPRCLRDHVRIHCLHQLWASGWTLLSSHAGK